MKCTETPKTRPNAPTPRPAPSNRHRHRNIAYEDLMLLTERSEPADTSWYQLRDRVARGDVIRAQLF